MATAQGKGRGGMACGQGSAAGRQAWAGCRQAGHEGTGFCWLQLGAWAAAHMLQPSRRAEGLSCLWHAAWWVGWGSHEREVGLSAWEGKAGLGRGLPRRFCLGRQVLGWVLGRGGGTRPSRWQASLGPAGSRPEVGESSREWRQVSRVPHTYTTIPTTLLYTDITLGGEEGDTNIGQNNDRGRVDRGAQNVCLSLGGYSMLESL